MGNRREIRAIRFNHITILGNCDDRFAHKLRILESHDPGKGDQMAEGNDFHGLVRSIPETMKHAAHPPVVRFQDLQGVLPSVALMDDDVEVESVGKVQLGAKGLGLRGFIGPSITAASASWETSA